MTGGHQGRLILLTGLSGSGKTTLGTQLYEYLQQHGPRPVRLLDGDVVRTFFDDDLKYSAEERAEATRRMAFGAFTLVESNVDVIMANIAGSRDVRDFLRRQFAHYIEIYL